MPVRKPPVGVMPRKIWEERRLIELLEVLASYLEEGFKPKIEWIDEAVEALQQLDGEK